MRLANLEGYLKFPGPFPVASIRLKYVARPAAAGAVRAPQGGWGGDRSAAGERRECLPKPTPNGGDGMTRPAWRLRTEWRPAAIPWSRLKAGQIPPCSSRARSSGRCRERRRGRGPRPEKPASWTGRAGSSASYRRDVRRRRDPRIAMDRTMAAKRRRPRPDRRRQTRRRKTGGRSMRRQTARGAANPAGRRRLAGARRRRGGGRRTGPTEWF